MQGLVGCLISAQAIAEVVCTPARGRQQTSALYQAVCYDAAAMMSKLFSLHDTSLRYINEARCKPHAKCLFLCASILLNVAYLADFSMQHSCKKSLVKLCVPAQDSVKLESGWGSDLSEGAVISTLTGCS